MPGEANSGGVYPSAPPQATAAHAHARMARLMGQLRRSFLFKATLVLGGLWLLSLLPELVGSFAWPWNGVARVSFVLCLFLLLIRLVLLLTSETLWLLRNRLILAYIFMGVVPVVLIAGMLAIGAYIFYGQYASYLLVNALSQRTKDVDAVNTLTVHELERRPATRAAEAAGLSNYYASYYFPRGFGSVHSYFYDAAGNPETPASTRFGRLSAWLPNGYTGVISLPEGYDIASFRAVGPGGERVLTVYPLSTRMLDALAQPLGSVSLVPLSTIGGASAGKVAPSAPKLASTHPLPAAASFFDIPITNFSPVPVRDWTTGANENVIAAINSRPSLLNAVLFTSLPIGNSPVEILWPLYLLGIIGVGFLIIEFFSLVAGIRLTRTITGAVNDLYVGTEHVNRGDFEHRIPVRTRDQLAALVISFNAMTSSIGRLLAEQRQKQRLESELTIAHEVQSQLFPRVPPRVPGFEIGGRCLPARVVSGDYFDFLPLGSSRVGIAVGDISGKGISAALLMATIVAAVRAYQPTLADMAVAAGAGGGTAAVAVNDEEADPARLLRRLNHQLYHSTPPEKYATLFYAVYDADRRELRYTNAGHLPPVIVGARGNRRLERGGMVVGLFENVSFDEGRVELEPGDLLAAWSDGVTEPENEYGVEFGEARLIELLESNRDRPLEDIFATVLARVRDWSGGGEQADDITLVLARVS